MIDAADESASGSGADALSPAWVFGNSRELPHSVHNLSGQRRKVIAYVAGCLAVLYECDEQTQQYLRAHTSPITATAASADRRWLVTADNGMDGFTVLWDTFTAKAVKIVDTGKFGGVQALSLSGDGTFLFILSQRHTSSGGGGQSLSIWEWTVDCENPLLAFDVPDDTMHHAISVDPTSISKVCTCSSSSVAFFHWSMDGQVQSRLETLHRRDIPRTVGRIVHTVLLRYSDAAISATSHGDIILWDSGSAEEKNGDDPDSQAHLELASTEAISSADLAGASTDAPSTLSVPPRRPLKTVRVHANAEIQCLLTYDDYIITGASDGHVRVFDRKLRVVAWYEDLAAGPVTSLSLSSFVTEEAASSANDVPAIPDMVVATSSSLVLYVRATTCDELSAEDRAGELLLYGQDGHLTALAAHPSCPTIAVGGTSGFVQIWDYEKKRAVISTSFENQRCTALAYDGGGRVLAVGFASGLVKFLNADSLTEFSTVRASRDPVVRLTSRVEGGIIACFDANRTVIVFRQGSDEGGLAEYNKDAWGIAGRIVAHHHAVRDLCFHNDSLYSVGDDRRIITYDIENFNPDGGLTVHAAFEADPSAVPLALTTHRDLLVASTSAYKFRTINVEDQCTEQIAASPALGSPITRMLPVTGSFAVFACSEGALGVVDLGALGNPVGVAATLGHASRIQDLSVSYDGKYVFSCASQESLMCAWKINVSEIHEAIGKVSRLDMVRLALENDFSPDFESDARALFCLLESSGDDNMSIEHGSDGLQGSIPIEKIPDFCRALGYFPSKDEVLCMMRELQRSSDVQNGRADLELALHCFANYRSATDLAPEDIAEAIKALGNSNEEIERDALVAALSSLGDRFDIQELESCLEELTGHARVDMALPAHVDASVLGEQVLGFDVVSM